MLDCYTAPRSSPKSRKSCLQEAAHLHAVGPTSSDYGERNSIGPRRIVDPPNSLLVVANPAGSRNDRLADCRHQHAASDDQETQRSVKVAKDEGSVYKMCLIRTNFQPTMPANTATLSPGKVTARSNSAHLRLHGRSAAHNYPDPSLSPPGSMPETRGGRESGVQHEDRGCGDCTGRDG